MKILITRESAEPLSSMLEEHGLETTHVPCVQLLATGLPAPHGPPPDAVLISSAAVVRFLPNLAAVIGNARVVAVGPSTANALVAQSVAVDNVGTQGGREALELLLQEGAVNPWYVGAKEPSEGLAAALRKTNLRRWSVYENVVPPDLSAKLSDESYDIVVFTSGSAVRAYVDAVGVPSVPVIVLGNSTKWVARDQGLTVDAVAENPTMAALVSAVRSVSLG